jgi:hypothetical protein
VSHSRSGTYHRMAPTTGEPPTYSDPGAGYNPAL